MKLLESFENSNGVVDGSFNKNSHKQKDKYLNFFSAIAHIVHLLEKQGKIYGDHCEDIHRDLKISGNF